MASTSREARASVSKFDRNAILWSGKWVEIDRVAETVELFLSAPFLERWNEKSQIDRCYSLLIELGISSEVYVISRNLVSRENDSHFIANVLFADESDQFLFGGMKTSVACENEFH